MFGSDGPSSFEQIASFVEGDRHACPFSTWVHYLQLAFLGLIFSVWLFCGTKTGG